MMMRLLCAVGLVGLVGCAVPYTGSSVTRSGPVQAADLRQSAVEGASRVAGGITNGRHQIYDYYKGAVPARLNGGALGQLDFSGIALEQTRTATLVSPRHVVMAAHYSRAVGHAVVFHNRSGRPVRATLVGVQRVPGTDVAVGLLDAPVPVSFYRVLEPRADYAALLSGVPALLTEQKRHVLIHAIGTVGNGRVSFRPAAELKGVAGKLVSGDSGNPSFILVNGEMILIETHTGGGFGSGPFYSDPSVFSAVNAAMRSLGGGARLSTVSLE